MMRQVIAAALSGLVPGAGQLFNREWAKGAAVLAMVAGMAASALMARSPATTALMGVLYLAVLVPAAMDAYQVAGGRPSRFTGGNRGYVIVMLLTIGPFALPLLWQSAFSRAAKWAWTLAIMVIAAVCILAMAALGPFLDQLLQRASQP